MVNSQPIHHFAQDKIRRSELSHVFYVAKCGSNELVFTLKTVEKMSGEDANKFMPLDAG